MAGRLLRARFWAWRLGVGPTGVAWRLAVGPMGVAWRLGVGPTGVAWRLAVGTTIVVLTAGRLLRARFWALRE